MIPGITASRRRSGAPPPFAPEYRLDLVSVNFESALSLRKLFMAATNAIRVRRSSDNAEQDIGFDGDGLDVAALLAFTVASSGYVRTIYDQSGNGCHAQQSIASAQPRIVDSGTYDGIIVFDGVDDFMTVAGMTFGTPYLGIFERIYQPAVSSSKIIAEATSNYNTASQAFLHFAGVVVGNSGWSLNSSNAAGQQRVHQYIFTQSGPETISNLVDRTVVGTNEVIMLRNGGPMTISNTGGTVEQTGNFGSHTVYIGARGGSSLFNNMQLDTMVFTSAPNINARPAIENAINRQPDEWRSRLNTPVSITKIGTRYFIADCWHHRILYSDDPTRQIWAWDTLDETNLDGPHSVASDGTLLVVDNTDRGRIEYYNATTFARIGSVSVSGNRPHRVVYDATTNAFYAIKSLSKQIVKLTRSGMTLSIAHTTTLSFLGTYVRSFRIIGGEMVFVNADGTIHTISFDGTAGGYSLTGTYNLPASMTDCNDVFKAASGKWYATSWDPAMIEFDSLAGMHAGTYTDVLSAWGVTGIPYWIEEFDSALWIGQIVGNNGILKRTSGTTTVVHDYGSENASSLHRHNNPP